MNKIRVIDLYNKIANREEVPSIIEYKNQRYFYNNGTHQYYSKNTSNCNYSLRIKLSDLYNLNDEIEIIEDTPKKIEKIKINSMGNIVNENNYTLPVTSETDGFLARKINEIINYINSKEDK